LKLVPPDGWVCISKILGRADSESKACNFLNSIVNCEPGASSRRVKHAVNDECCTAGFGPQRDKNFISPPFLCFRVHNNLFLNLVTQYNGSRSAMECDHCTKPASMSCKACKTAPVLDGDSGIIHYCNSVCQKEDWPRHKSTCLRLKDRTTLYRVVGTAQKLFYIYRELVWHKFDIQSIDKIGDNLALRGEVGLLSFSDQTASTFIPFSKPVSLVLTRPLLIDIPFLDVRE
jgi:MYND finger